MESFLFAESKFARLLIRLRSNFLTARSYFLDFMDKEYAEYLLEKTREDYNLIADEFSRTREKPWEELKPLFDYYTKNRERVLDLGCGNGRYYDFLKEKQVEYTGLDNSEKLIELAKKRYPGLNFQIGDALRLPLPDNYFDKVFSIAVLHHFPSEGIRLESLDEVRRVLKKGGLLILTVWKFHEKKEILLLIKYTFLKVIRKSKLDFKDILEPWGKKAERYYHWFSERELIKLFDKSGFKIREAGVIRNKKGNRRNIYIIAEKT